MSAIDAPPGVAFAGEAAGEFVARPRPRRLAGRVFAFVTIVGVITIVLTARHIFAPFAEVMLVIPLVCVSIAFVGYAVRRAHLRVDADGVRWGWRVGGFRMSPDRMKGVAAYHDAIAVEPKRGSTWYLSERDWDRFDRLLEALSKGVIST